MVSKSILFIYSATHAPTPSSPPFSSNLDWVSPKDHELQLSKAFPPSPFFYSWKWSPFRVGRLLLLVYPQQIPEQTDSFRDFWTQKYAKSKNKQTKCLTNTLPTWSTSLKSFLFAKMYMQDTPISCSLKLYAVFQRIGPKAKFYVPSGPRYAPNWQICA